MTDIRVESLEDLIKVIMKEHGVPRAEAEELAIRFSSEVPGFVVCEKCGTKFETMYCDDDVLCEKCR